MLITHACEDLPWEMLSHTRRNFPCGQRTKRSDAHIRRSLGPGDGSLARLSTGQGGP